LWQISVVRISPRLPKSAKQFLLFRIGPTMNLSPNEIQRRRLSEGRSNNNNQGQQNLVSGLAAQWLEQQQVLQQQLQNQRSTTNPSVHLPDTVPQQQQRMLTQRPSQLGGSVGSAGLPPSNLELQQRAYLLDLQRRQQELPLSQQQQQEALMMMLNEARDTRGGADLSQNIARLLAGSAAPAAPTPTLPGRTTVQRPLDQALIDRLLAAELSSGDRRSKIEEATRVLQLHEALQQQQQQQQQRSLPEAPFAFRQDTLPPLPTNVAAMSPSSYMRFRATTNSAPQQPDPPAHILPAMFNSGSVGLPPLARTQYKTATSSVEKRKAEDPEMGTEKKRAASITTIAPGSAESSFPLPSRKRARAMTFALTSYRELWEDLEESEIQEEAFRRRIFESIKIQGVSRSVLKKP
jgi:hypothetical protein